MPPPMIATRAVDCIVLRPPHMNSALAPFRRKDCL